MSVSVAVLLGDVNQSVRVSVSWARPYRVCQCECLSVRVLVSVSLIARAEWTQAERVFPIRHARAHTRRLFVWRKRAIYPWKCLMCSHGAGDDAPHVAPPHLKHGVLSVKCELCRAADEAPLLVPLRAL